MNDSTRIAIIEAEIRNINKNILILAGKINGILERIAPKDDTHPETENKEDI
jgi:hypothetical protein